MNSVNILQLWLAVCLSEIHKTGVNCLCPEKWRLFDEWCYLPLRGQRRVRWHQAMTACYDVDPQSNLVSIQTENQAKFVSEILADFDPDRRGVWLTSGYFSPRGTFEWSATGQNFATYFWHKNENREHSYVAYTFKNGSYKWSTIKSDELGYAVCQRFSDLLSFRYSKKKCQLAPEFLEEPTDLVVYPESQTSWVTLSCRAKACGRISYEWFSGYNERVKISELTVFVQINGDLMINVKTWQNSMGDFYCTATTQFGTIRSRKVSVETAYMKSFDATRSDVYVTENFGKSVPCLAPDHFPASISLSWMYDSVKQFLPDQLRVFVGGDGTLHFSHVTLSDQRNYSCTVVVEELQAGHYGPFFQIKVVPAKSQGKINSARPIIPDLFPKSYPAVPQIGKAAWLECFAYGKPSPNYTWQRKDNPLNLSDRLTLRSFGRKLFFDFLKTEDAGTYVCTAKNYLGTISKEIQLVIKALPVTLTELKHLTVPVMSNFTLFYEAFGNPQVEYEWFKNGKPLNYLLLSKKDRKRIFISANKFSLHDAYENDTGAYQCFATNSLGQSTSSAYVKIMPTGLMKNTTRTNPEIIYAFQGTDVEISCSLPGDPSSLTDAKVQWHQEWTDEISTNFDGKFEQKLKLLNVSHTDSGRYVCLIGNGPQYARVVSNLVVLPFMKLNFSRIDVKGQVTYDCSTVGSQAGIDVPIELKLNGHSIEEGEIFTTLLAIEKNCSQIVAHFYDSQALIGQDMSCQLCKNGKFSRKVPIVVKKADLDQLTVLNFTVHDVTPYSAVISWKWLKLMMENSHFNLSARMLQETNFSSIGQYAVQPIFQAAHIANLTPTTTYEFRLSVEGIESPVTLPFLVTTVSTHRSIENITLTLLPMNQCLVQWQMVASSDFWRSQSINYTVRIHAKKFSGNMSEEYVRFVESNRNFYVITFLQPESNNQYEIFVTASNRIGQSMTSEPATARLDECPFLSDTVIIDAFNESSIRISWNAKKSNKNQSHIDCQQSFEIAVKKFNSTTGQQTFAVFSFDATNEHTVFSNLQPDTLYRVEIRSIDNYRGNVKNFLVKTYKKAPKDRPIGISVIQHFYSIEVKWAPVLPRSDTEQIQGYRLVIFETTSCLPFILLLKVDKNASFDGQKVLLGNLRYFALYEIQIGAFNKGGLGPLSQPVIFRFGEKTPSSNGVNTTLKNWSFRGLLVVVILHMLLL